MTLAHILLIGLLSASPWWTPSAGEGVEQSQSASQQQNSPAGPVQNAPAAPANSSAQSASGQAAPEAKPAEAGKNAKPKKPSKRKNASVTCSTSAPKSQPANHPAVSNPKTVPSNCPPTKVIVTQGSTTDPSIELAGGASGAQASNERNTSIQMLEITEANLKKVEAAQLDPDQRNVVKQVRQFMDQSKTANSAGDLDQARTLAWKAQLLSEELLKTQK